MRLYHLLPLITLLLASCVSPHATQALIQVNLTADGQTVTLQLSAGSTVQEALDQAGVSLNALDRTEPPEYTVLRQGGNVRVVRVTEEFEVEQVVTPYEQQILRNESLPVDKEVLIQKGKNGLQEITYRRVYEDGVETSSGPVVVKSVLVEEPIPEIRMIGVQAPFSPVAIPGKLIYLRDSNVWSIEGNTGNRQAVLTTEKTSISPRCSIRPCGISPTAAPPGWAATWTRAAWVAAIWRSPITPVATATVPSARASSRPSG